MIGIRAVERASLGALLLILGCGQNHSGHSPSANDVPIAVSIPATEISSGVAIGPLTRTDTVAGFRIAKHPVTSAQYRDCVSAGACSTPAQTNCLDKSAQAPFNQLTTSQAANADLPAICVGVDQAEAFCSWVGGQLPTLAQFMLAARGSSVTRYPWGNQPATCKQLPDALRSPFTGPVSPCTSPSDALKNFAVGQHPAGASPLGVEDVLLAPGELVGTSSNPWTPSCGSPYAGCVAYGLLPGAIDAFEALPPEGTAHHAYEFRCVWN